MSGKTMSRRVLWLCGGVFCLPLPVFASVAPTVGDKTSTSGVSEPFSAGSLLQFGFGLVVVVGMIFGLAWVLRRMNRIQGNVQGRLRILAGLPLGARERAVLIQVGDEQILLGVAPGRVSRLHVLKQPLEVGSQVNGADDSAGFAARLAAAMQRGRRK